MSGVGEPGLANIAAAEAAGVAPEITVHPDGKNLLVVRRPLSSKSSSGQEPDRRIVKKSPHELAAQIESVHSVGYSISETETGAKLRADFEQARKHLEELQESGVSDDVLAQELERMYEEGVESGAYSPDEGLSAEALIASEKERHLSYGHSEEEAEAEAVKHLRSEGYLGALRQERRISESAIERHFTSFDSEHELTAEEEKQRINALGERCYLMSSPEQMAVLGQDFPGGNFLYHGTHVEQALKILDDGELLNSAALFEREDAETKAGGRATKIIRRNTGYEGVSWNYNNIGAMPGDRYHLVGFLASPGTALQDGLQLAIPSRPAPHELILINGEINSKRFYELKTQDELLFTFSVGESNSVWHNIFTLGEYKSFLGRKKSPVSSSMLNDFESRHLTDEQTEVLLRGKFNIREDGSIELSPDLLQQVSKDIPVAAVWMQALIDTGRIKGVGGFEDVATVSEAISRIDEKSMHSLFEELKKDKIYLDQLVEVEEEKIKPIAVPTSEMYFVVPSTDLHKWLKVLARCKTLPKGIVIYDHNKIRMENFASLHRGDNAALTEELRKAIPQRDGYIDYEDQILGEDITPEKIGGYRRHVVAERYLKNRKSLKKDSTGEIIIQD